MSPVTRYHRGTARIDAHMLTELDWLLDMDQAADRATAEPIAAQIAALLRQPGAVYADVCHLDEAEGIHDYLTVQEVDAVQRLRGDHRAGSGPVDVDAGALSEVRNLLDRLTMSWQGCEENADGNPYDYPPAELAYVRAQLAKSPPEICYRCTWCQFLIMRDRIDYLLDQQGFTDRNAYIAVQTEDPEVVWRERVIGPVPAVA
jgi:hypothetical protein